MPTGYCSQTKGWESFYWTLWRADANNGGSMPASMVSLLICGKPPSHPID
jgi:hypothetical protein